jgi:hypothetical protein
MDRAHGEHLERLRAGVLKTHTLATAGDWICNNTYLRGELFSFKDHEFQRVIVDDPSREKNVRKCSQIGLSELSMRLTLALPNILDATTWIYTMPAAAFAKLFVKTRMDPVIETSPALRDAVDKTTDNMEIKRFGDSFVYIKGTIGQAAAISVPADGVIHDEVDFSDQQVMSNYQSRLTHSPWKIKYRFSTPTVGGYGISAEFDVSRRYWQFSKCDHCNEWFLPSYFKHVHIPGFNGDKKEITKDRLGLIRWQEAVLLCPGCGREPDLGPERRAWVCENPGDNFEAAGYQIQPFDAPRIITMPQLVKSLTEYDRFVDAVNFGLGLPAEDKETSLTEEDVERCKVMGTVPGFFTHVMGIDLGLQCHIMVGAVNPYGQLMTVHTEVVPLSRLEERKIALAIQYRVALTVSDALPYTDMVLRMQAKDQNLYGAMYVNLKSLKPYIVGKREEEDKAGEGEKKSGEGEQREREVRINRSKAFDALMQDVRAGNWILVADDNYELVKKHLQDMKRIKEFTVEREVSYVWQKSAKGQDHFHHTLMYLWIAAKMRGVVTTGVALPFFVGKFKIGKKF